MHLAQLASLLSRVPRRPENPDCSHLIHLQKIAEVVQHEQEADDRFELAHRGEFTGVLNYFSMKTPIIILNSLNTVVMSVKQQFGL